MADQTTTVTFTVNITSYGHPEKVAGDALQTLQRVLGLAFTTVEITTASVRSPNVVVDFDDPHFAAAARRSLQVCECPPCDHARLALSYLLEAGR